MSQFKFVNIKCILRQISELVRDKVVQYFVEIFRFEICNFHHHFNWLKYDG